MVAATVEKFGSLDILANDAGIESTPSLLKDIPEAQWDRVLAVNLKGVFLCCQAVIPQMMKQNKGRIINISSLAGVKIYTASKHGGIGLAPPGSARGAPGLDTFRHRKLSRRAILRWLAGPR